MPASSAWVNSRDRFSITARPIFACSFSASPKAIIAGSSRWPKPSNVRDTPTRPGYALKMLAQIFVCAVLLM